MRKLLRLQAKLFGYRRVRKVGRKLINFSYQFQRDTLIPSSRTHYTRMGNRLYTIGHTAMEVANEIQRELFFKRNNVI